MPLALLLALAPSAWAQEIRVVVDPTLARQAGVDPARAEAEIAEAAAMGLDLVDPQAFLDQMANANALATKGMGVDYASNPQRFYAGASFGTASSGGGLSLGQASAPLEGPGFAVQASATVGVNLGMLADDGSFWRRVVISANGVVSEGETAGVTTAMENVGGHVQLKAVLPRAAGPITWGGLDLTTGYEVASYRLLIPSGGTIRTEDLRWDGSGTLDLFAESRSIPLEVSTNARFAVFSAYVGAAVDIRPTVTSGGQVALGGPLVAYGRGQDTTIGSVDATHALTGAADLLAPRLFTGLQLNIHVVKVYGHLNVGVGDTYAGHVGARVAL